MMKVNPQIFRAYDIRGVYPKEINEKLYFTLAKVFADSLRPGPIVVGRDLRPSSFLLARSFIKGLRESSRNVLDAGQITTPMLYFAVVEFKAAAGVMITASHNPPQYNGIKFVKDDGLPVSGKEIQKQWQMLKK
jgi:phosphomannomutase